MHTNAAVIYHELDYRNPRGLRDSIDSISSEKALFDDVEGQNSTELENLRVNQHEDEENIILPLPEAVSINKRSTTYLDGLRGVAALCVFTQHLIGFGDWSRGFGDDGYYTFISFHFIRVFWSGGAAAVVIFFVLSGFVVSQSSLKAIHQGQSDKCKTGLISAVIRRPIRLYLPCFAISVVIAVVKQIPGHPYPDQSFSPVRDNVFFELGHMIVKFCQYFWPFQHHAWTVGGFYEYDDVLWTIPIELKGSILIYVLAAAYCFSFYGRISGWMVVAILLGLIVILLQVAWWEGASFIAGLMLSIIDLSEMDVRYLFCHFKRPWMKTSFVYFVFFLGWWLLSEPANDGIRESSSNTPGWGFLTSIIPQPYDGNNYYRFWHTYGAIFLLWASLHLPIFQAILNTRPLQYLGWVSFMLYAVHRPLIYFTFHQLFQRSIWTNFIDCVPNVGPLGLNLRWDVTWIVMLSITLAFAHTFTRLIDQPSVRLGKLLVPWLTDLWQSKRHRELWRRWT